MTQKALPNDTVLFTYDKADNITKVEDGDSLVSFAYDLAGRLVQTSVAPKGPSDTAQPAVTLSYTYDLNNNRATMTSPMGTTSYTYDANGQLRQITGPKGETFSFEYDALGRRTKLTYPNGMVTTYAYDAASQLTKIETRRRDGTAVARHEYTYDGAGNRTRMTELDLSAP